MQVWNKTSYTHFHIILISGFLFSFFLPLSTKISNILLIVFLVSVSFLVLKGRLKFNKINRSALKYSTLILMVPLLLSICYHGELLSVLNVLGRRISYLLLPLSFLFFSSEQLLSLKRSSFRGIVYGCTLSSIFLLSNNIWNYYATRPLWSVDSDLLNFYYTGFNFTETLDFHPSYLGMYMLLSVCVLLFSKVFVSRALKIIIFTFLSIVILFLSSRIIFIYYFIILIVYIFSSLLKLFGKSKIAIISIFTVVLIIFLSTFLLIKDTYIYTSLTKETIWELSFNVNKKYNSKTLGDSRVARWNVAIDLIKDHPIVGYGIGNEKDVLEIGYRKEGMLISATNRYDAHNLFLGYALEAGFISMAILIFYIFNSLFFFFRLKSALNFLFFFAIFGICLVEDYLNNNAAIIFLAYFGNLFLFQTFLSIAKIKDELS
jgi:O-antigen ligase